MNTCISIYFLFNNNELVYIGKTTSVKNRISSHVNDGVKEFDSYSSLEFENSSDAHIYELLYIDKYKPTYNADCKEINTTSTIKVELADPFKLDIVSMKVDSIYDKFYIEYCMNDAKVDSNVFRLEDKILSIGAKDMYAYILDNGQMLSFNDICVAFGITTSSLTKYKKQLKDLDLICMDRIGAKQYVMYIGSTFIPASKVREYWVELEREIKPITRKDLFEMREKYNK